MKKIFIAKEQIIELNHNQSKTCAEIGIIFNCSRYTVCRLAKEYNITLKDNGRYIDGRTLVVTYCCDCPKKLGKLAKYNGQVRCNSCARKYDWSQGKMEQVHKSDCICCICKAKRHELVGKNNGMFDVHKFGKESSQWKGGISPLVDLIRSCYKNKQWIKDVFIRDNYTCQSCFQHGSNLEAHHIKSFSVILKEFLQLYNRFSPVEDKEVLFKLALDYQPFWDVANGQTLCQPCHRKTFKNDRTFCTFQT